MIERRSENRPDIKGFQRNKETITRVAVPKLKARLIKNARSGWYTPRHNTISYAAPPL